MDKCGNVNSEKSVLNNIKPLAMSTLTASRTGTINFLNTLDFVNREAKCPDWRYEAWNKLSPYRSRRDGEREKAVYWVGLINLRKVKKDTRQYPLLIAYNHGLEKDSYIARHEDGAPVGRDSTIFYNLSCVLSEMLQAKRYRYHYYHLFLKEEVDYHGNHKVSILAMKDREKGTPIGIKSRKPWPQEKAGDWVVYANRKFMRDDKLESFPVLLNDEYNWMK